MKPCFPTEGAGSAWDADGPASRGLQDAPLAGRDVVLACLAGRTLTALRATLLQAGAHVVEVDELTAVRRRTALLGGAAAVVIDLPPALAALHTVMPALRTQQAVVLLGRAVSAAERIALLRSGADHVLGTVEAGEVVACVLSVLRRVAYAPPAPHTLSVGELSVDLTSRTATASGQCLTLTALEFDLLAYFMSKAGHALSRERLLADVWGYDIGGLDTVTVHVRRLRMKIEPDPSRPVVLTTVWGTGYRLEAGAVTVDDEAPPGPVVGVRLKAALPAASQLVVC